MTMWNESLNFYALEVKGLQQDYIFKNRPFYISFVIFNTFPSRSEYSKKKKYKKNSILPSYPKFSQSVTWTTHFFIWPKSIDNFALISVCWRLRQGLETTWTQGRHQGLYNLQQMMNINFVPTLFKKCLGYIAVSVCLLICYLANRWTESNQIYCTQFGVQEHLFIFASLPQGPWAGVKSHQFVGVWNCMPLTARF